MISPFLYYLFLKTVAPKIKARRKRTMKMKNKTCAIDAAPSAIPPNPKMAATIAMIKKITAQRNIILNFSLFKNYLERDFRQHSPLQLLVLFLQSWYTGVC